MSCSAPRAMYSRRSASLIHLPSRPSIYRCRCQWSPLMTAEVTSLYYPRITTCTSGMAVWMHWPSLPALLCRGCHYLLPWGTSTTDWSHVRIHYITPTPLSHATTRRAAILWCHSRSYSLRSVSPLKPPAPHQQARLQLGRSQRPHQELTSKLQQVRTQPPPPSAP